MSFYIQQLLNGPSSPHYTGFFRLRHTWPFQCDYVMREVVDMHFVVKKYINYYYYFFRKWQIVSLDKTLIPRLGSCSALEAALKLQFNLLVPLKSTTWKKKSWNVFLKNLNFFLTEERKTWTSWITWGWVNYQKTLILEWTNPLRLETIMTSPLIWNIEMIPNQCHAETSTGAMEKSLDRTERAL